VTGPWGRAAEPTERPCVWPARNIPHGEKKQPALTYEKRAQEMVGERRNNAPNCWQVPVSRWFSLVGGIHNSITRWRALTKKSMWTAGAQPKQKKNVQGHSVTSCTKANRGRVVTQSLQLRKESLGTRAGVKGTEN